MSFRAGQRVFTQYSDGSWAEAIITKREYSVLDEEYFWRVKICAPRFFVKTWRRRHQIRTLKQHAKCQLSH